MSNVTRLDVSSFGKALASLDEAVTVYRKDPSNQFVRDASIQRFEYTYELSYKMLKRYLEMSEPSAEDVDQMSFPNIIRTGSERGLLLNGWDTWIKYRDACNITSHTYNESKAIQVCAVIPEFLNDSKYLFEQLQKRIITL